ncbi:MAG TPA: hypothetical protein VJS64_12280 [Pyrinomonadaceae bacterium]|nr:hypothetical protein [Pyrinomonadaceae bacterium]
MVALQKSLIVGLILVAVAYWNWCIYLDSYYYEHGATTPSVAEGRIYPMKVHHGWQVFLTKKEKFNLEVFYPSICLGSFLIAGLLDLRWKHFAFKRDVQGVDLFYWFRKNKKK